MFRKSGNVVATIINTVFGPRDVTCARPIMLSGVTMLAGYFGLRPRGLGDVVVDAQFDLFREVFFLGLTGAPSNRSGLLMSHRLVFFNVDVMYQLQYINNTLIGVVVTIRIA